jgi:hypothetical protein
VGALSDERSGLSLVSQSSVLGLCMYVRTVYLQNLLDRIQGSALCRVFTWPLSVQAQYSRLCPITGSFRYNGSLDT